MDEPQKTSFQLLYDGRSFAARAVRRVARKHPATCMRAPASCCPASTGSPRPSRSVTSAERPAPSWPRRRSAPPPAAARSWPWPCRPAGPAPPLASSRPNLRCASALPASAARSYQSAARAPSGVKPALRRLRQRIVESGELELRPAGCRPRRRGATPGRPPPCRRPCAKSLRLGQHRLGRGLGREIFADRSRAPISSARPACGRRRRGAGAGRCGRRLGDDGLVAWK